MCRWIRVGKDADLLLLIVQQPADTVLRCMAINKWVVLVWHADDSEALMSQTALWQVHARAWGIVSSPFSLVWGMRLHYRFNECVCRHKQPMKGRSRIAIGSAVGSRLVEDENVMIPIPHSQVLHLTKGPENDQTYKKQTNILYRRRK